MKIEDDNEVEVKEKKVLYISGEESEERRRRQS
jgi:hypothetical protein